MKSIKLLIVMILSINLVLIDLTCISAFSAHHRRIKSRSEPYDDSCESIDKEAEESEYLVDIEVISRTKSTSTPCDSKNGFQIIEGSHSTPTDLNENGGGNYVFMCQKIAKVKSGDPYINDIRIVIANTHKELDIEVERALEVGHFHKCHPTDLNDKSGGKPTRICWSITNMLGQVPGIASLLIDSHNSCPAQFRNHQCLCDSNLNADSGWLSWNNWLCIKKNKK